MGARELGSATSTVVHAERGGSSCPTEEDTPGQNPLRPETTPDHLRHGDHRGDTTTTLREDPLSALAPAADW